MRDIKELRQAIDQIDMGLVRLFEQRMTIVEEVAKYKEATGIALKDVNREKALIEKNIQLLENPAFEKYLKTFFKDLLSYSRRYQASLMASTCTEKRVSYSEAVVGFQGVEGSFSSMALSGFFGDVKSRRAMARFEDIFQGLESGDIDYGILPIENSSTGAINEVYDLMHRFDAHIIGDYYLPVRHHLIGLPGAQYDDIQAVYSHEQGFKQSRNYLSDKPWQQYSYCNTAKSVAYIKEMNDIKNAAIASAAAAEYYGMLIIEHDIQDISCNTTRFVVVAKKPIVAANANKVSLILWLAHETGALFEIMVSIAKYNINMLKLESRPIPDKPWEYLFYMDLEGHLESEAMGLLLTEIKKESHDIMVLGNYYSRNGVE